MSPGTQFSDTFWSDWPNLINIKLFKYTYYVAYEGFDKIICCVEIGEG